MDERCRLRARHVTQQPLEFTFHAVVALADGPLEPRPVQHVDVAAAAADPGACDVAFVVISNRVFGGVFSSFSFSRSHTTSPSSPP